MIAGTPARASAQPSWRRTSSAASSSVSSRRPIAVDGRVDRRIERRNAAPHASPPAARGRIATVSMLIAATIESSGTAGWAAK